MISIGGGDFPRWRRDGGELYYVTPGSNSLMVVTVSTTGGKFEAGTPQRLFTLPTGAKGYEPSSPSPISVILNWKPPDR